MSQCRPQREFGFPIQHTAHNTTQIQSKHPMPLVFINFNCRQMQTVIYE